MIFNVFDASHSHASKTVVIADEIKPPSDIDSAPSNTQMDAGNQSISSNANPDGEENNIWSSNLDTCAEDIIEGTKET